jgi:hypothetical protein
MVCYKNIYYDIIEENKENNPPTYNELFNELKVIEKTKKKTIEIDSLSLEIKYNHYSIKELKKICEYYNLNTNLEKDELIISLIMFEQNPDNINIVCKRNKLWNYMNEIKKDKYLSKYLIFN